MFSQPTSNRTDDENGPVKSRLGISVGGKIAIIVSIFVIGAIFCGGLFLRKRQKEDDNGDETSMGSLCQLCSFNTKGESHGPRRSETHNPEGTSRFHQPFWIPYPTEVIENEYECSIKTEHPVTTDSPVIIRQNQSSPSDLTSFRSPNSTSDAPSQEASGVEENYQSISDSTISITNAYPSMQARPGLVETSAHLRSVNARPLPDRPVSEDRPYAELDTEDDRANEFPPTREEQSYHDPLSLWASDPNLFRRSSVVGPHPNEVPPLTVGVDDCARVVQPGPERNGIPDEVISEGSVDNHSTHEYEYASIPGDHSMIRSLRGRGAQSQLSCSDKKYYSIQGPLLQGESKDVQAGEHRYPLTGEPPSQGPYYYGLEPDGMIQNPLYKSLESFFIVSSLS
ncbi:uncharacterized protein LOC135155633 isoform X1 [Lytechinus pictus]|uniref:uncharacterized protein LOC135155633 isoform X1 n=1 Tax=Lytechinus pictus TaxID=7653 RepID=UPI0030B9AF9A